MKILITGANGLIGQNLVKRLVKEGHEVTALVRKTSKLNELKDILNLNLAYGDVRDLDSLREVMGGQEIVFHLAAIVHLPYKEKETYYDVNVKGTENVLIACSGNKTLKKLIHCSSVGCYAPLNEELHEDSPCHSQSLYGKSKYEAEKMIKKFVKSNPIHYVIIRPARVYGPGDLTLLPLFKMVKNGRFFNMGKMDAKMMPVHIDDMMDAFIQAMDLPIQDGQIYNIAGPEVVTVKKFMDTIANIMDKNIPKYSIPMPLVKSLAILVQGVFGIINKDPPISIKKLRFFTHSEIYSINKAKEELGFNPSIFIDKGLEDLYSWYKENKLI
jgi:nucleoside-diphosphate-sugar epimerase